MRADEFLEEWDKDFLDQVIQVEERALSSQAQSQPQPPLLSHLPPSSHSNPFPPPVPSAVTYSPPRELSQRTTADISDSHSISAFSSYARRLEVDKELEIARLKKELGLFSKQLSELKQECSELRKKERDKKEEQLKAMNEKKNAGDRNSAGTNFSRGGRESDDIILINHEVSRQFQNAVCSRDQPGYQINIGVSTSKSTGVQTDETSASTQDDLTYGDLSKTLLAIWGSPIEQDLGRNLISNLLMDCQTDFRFLFGYVGMNMSSKLRKDKGGDDSSSIAALLYHSDMPPTSEAANVYHLCSVLTKAKTGMVKLEALIQPLVNLCSVKNVIIVQASLHILHEFLKHLFSLERQVEGRVNVTVEGLYFKNNIESPHVSEEANKGSYAGSLPLGMKFPCGKAQSENGFWNNGIATWVSHIDWVSLFEVILQTSMKNTEQGVRLEAVSVMNMIIMRSNAFGEREKFGQTLVFEVISHFLVKEAGFEVQKEAIQLLYMLLNCPKILAQFCSDYKEGKGAGAVDSNVGCASAYHKFSMIFQGLSDCIACCGNGVQELKLRKNAVLLLAFLASSGKSGFEIFVSHKLFQDANFLMLILQVLASEVDTEGGVDAHQPQIFKERTLLIREGLILLNRMVSNPAYCGTVLRSLTDTRDMASLTIDVANRLSRKHQICDKFDGYDLARQMRESEIVDLARAFKKRVFTYLGDNVP